MRIFTNVDLAISANTMHQYVTGPTTLKAMMCMLLDELDKGARVVYSNATEGKIHFQEDVTVDYTDTIMDYRSWHQFTIFNHHEDIKDLVLPYFSESE